MTKERQAAVDGSADWLTQANGPCTPADTTSETSTSPRIPANCMKDKIEESASNGDVKRGATPSGDAGGNEDRAPSAQPHEIGQRPAPMGLKRPKTAAERLSDKSNSRSRAFGWICKFAGTHKVRASSLSGARVHRAPFATHTSLMPLSCATSDHCTLETNMNPNRSSFKADVGGQAQQFAVPPPSARYRPSSHVSDQAALHAARSAETKVACGPGDGSGGSIPRHRA